MKQIHLYILAAVFVFAASCTSADKQDEIILAQVGNDVLTLEETISSIPEHVLSTDSIGLLKRYRDEWVQRQLILQEANRLNFTQQKSIQQKLKRIQDDFLVQAVQEYIIGEFEQDLSVTEEDARNYYQQNKEKFVLDERYVKYRHLIASSRADAQNAKDALMYGRPWDEVAKKYSQHSELKIRESERFWPSSIAGGDIAMLNRYLEIIGPSEISPIYRSGNEYHFVQLLEEKPKGEHPDLDWLIAQIKDWLVLEKRKRAFNTYVKNLYLQGQANNEIKIYNVLSEETTQQ